MIADTSGSSATTLAIRLLVLSGGLAVIYFIPFLGWVFGPLICLGAAPCFSPQQT